MNPSRPAVYGLVPCATVLLTVATAARRDAMTATAVFVSERPPMLSVSLANHLLTRRLIDEAGEFVVNLAATDQAELATKLGSTHGVEVDKFSAFGLVTEPAEAVAAPRIAGSYASLDCKVAGSFAAGDYTVYVCDVAAYAVDESRRPLVWHQGSYFPI